jgi:hypothetical protein
MTEPGQRIELRGERKGLIKSFWFKTFSHYSFTEARSDWELFYINNKKIIQKNLIMNNLTDRGLAYYRRRIMGDGSLQKDNKTLILHTQSYTEARSERI